MVGSGPDRARSADASALRRLIDDVRIYDRALGIVEIQALAGM